MQWFAVFTVFLSITEGFEATLNESSMNILNCLVCRLGNNCHEEYNSCFPKKKITNVSLNQIPLSVEIIPPDSQVHCKIGNYTRAKELQCYGGDFGITEIDCFKPLPVKTLVKYSCPTFYQASASTVSLCESDGTWSEPIKCVPECGKTLTKPQLTPLILSGREVQSHSQWPWAAALYIIESGSEEYDFKCGATLVGDNILVTAAHCTNKDPSSNLLVVLNTVKIGLSIPKDKADLHGHKVKRTYVLPAYKGVDNDYNSDISVLILKSRVSLSRNVQPACLPSTNITVKPYTHAIVAGWGITEKKNASNELLYVKVPIVDTLHCLKKLPDSFIKFLAFTAFCAGYRNGTGVCSGDSGGGLLTKNDEGLWELHGIVSMSPSVDRTLSCHSRMYSLYTKVYLFLAWIEKIVKFEERDVDVKKKHEKYKP